MEIGVSQWALKVRKVLADILGESVQNLNLGTNETSVSVEVRNATTKRNLERAIREVSKPKTKR